MRDMAVALLYVLYVQNSRVLFKTMIKGRGVIMKYTRGQICTYAYYVCGIPAIYENMHEVMYIKEVQICI